MTTLKQNFNLQNLISTVFRFPLVSLSSLFGTILGVCWVLFEYEYPVMMKLFLLCLLGILLFLAIALFLEQQNWKLWQKWLVRATGIVFLGLYYFILPGVNNDELTRDVARYMILFGCFCLSVLFIGYLTKNNDEYFWHFVKNLAIMFVITGAISGFVFGALSIALLAVSKLFVFNLSENIFFTIWIILVVFAAVHFFLLFVPKKIRSLAEKSEPPVWIKAIGKYLLVPIVCLYFLIVYVYSIKILFTGEWPKGIVASLIIGFSIFGIITCLIIWAYKNKSKWLRIFYRALFIAIVPLTGILFWAIKIRINDYGVTERRYLVVLMGIWLLGIGLLFAIWKKASIKIIPISICVILILSLFGPWGMFEISKNSQLNQLQALLEKHQILVDDKISTGEKLVPKDDYYKLQSSVRYIISNHGYENLQPWFERNLDLVLEGKDRYAWDDLIMVEMGIKKDFVIIK
ncbi:DUF4153 domain-containing protein [Candidatus Kuenenbacteria bacterium]|nr:DUF4153 domain-containing protein [Candidatus Kuenenbacteria bacterium]